ncbi:hypothetical protein NE237_013368 [Protea cynaroides]|uniref:Dirigent protein n=1 Tax=Protea cynaroides TaxID=273540 RepID=A0A9Q0JZQ4_9MAGN|nr:hypothetical protein NE237_013368 [Protea cynaroides]
MVGSSSSKLASSFIVLFLLFQNFLLAAGFAEWLSQRSLGGRNPTSVRVVESSTNTLSTGFGLMSMIDDPLTEGPEMRSKLVGTVQGFYASALQQELGLLMAMNFAFMDGKYNGSTITIMGINTVFSAVREKPMIGGSGFFRFARGYVKAKTHNFNVTTGNTVVEYDVHSLPHRDI